MYEFRQANIVIAEKDDIDEPGLKILRLGLELPELKRRIKSRTRTKGKVFTKQLPQ